MEVLKYPRVSKLITKIPIEKLVPAICEFYWDMGHKKIKLTRGPRIFTGEQNDLTLNSDIKLTVEDYDPVKGIENIGKISQVSVLTQKQKELKICSVQIAIEAGIFETKTSWYVAMKERVYYLYAVYFVVSALVSLYYAVNMCSGAGYWERPCGIFFLTLFLVILALPAFYSYERAIDKVDSHPSTEKYRKDFEEFIRKMEKEFLSERY